MYAQYIYLHAQMCPHSRHFCLHVSGRPGQSSGRTSIKWEGCVVYGRADVNLVALSAGHARSRIETSCLRFRCPHAWPMFEVPDRAN